MIDYCTVSGNTTTALVKILSMFDAEGIYFKRSNRLNYTHSAYFCGCGFYVHAGERYRDYNEIERIYDCGKNLPFCCQISGEGIAYLIEKDVLNYFFETVKNEALNCTRIDVTQDYPIFMEEFEKSYFEKKTIFTAPSFKYITTDKGNSLYIGSRTSECFIRIYDKMSELLGKLSIVPLTRVEFELKGKMAKLAMSDIIKDEYIEQNIDYVYSSCVNRYVKITDLITSDYDCNFQVANDYTGDIVRFIDYMRTQMSCISVYKKLIGEEQFAKELLESEKKEMKDKYKSMMSNVGIKEVLK